ncbi:hypothetical protein Ahy_B02g059015 [Arachis hypogaea]|uniref:Uncharacterized protein n=1 Tax=Arachis hypogaea TaxID=3818 RepID=A0A445AFY5_ARAHY|nr:hypothetical protein Ahy_B02g059015 [Arachis hypogaea]
MKIEKISDQKINPSAGLNCPARIYIHVLKDVDQAQMLKQHRELSMSVRRTIENNEETGIRPSKTFQSFVAAAGGHRELNFIEKTKDSFDTNWNDFLLKYGLVDNKWLSVYEVREQVSSSIFNKFVVIRLSSSPSEMPVLIIGVKRDIVPSHPKRVKL